MAQHRSSIRLSLDAATVMMVWERWYVILCFTCNQPIQSFRDAVKIRLISLVNFEQIFPVVSLILAVLVPTSCWEIPDWADNVHWGHQCFFFSFFFGWKLFWFFSGPQLYCYFHQNNELEEAETGHRAEGNSTTRLVSFWFVTTQHLCYCIWSMVTIKKHRISNFLKMQRPLSADLIGSYKCTHSYSYRTQTPPSSRFPSQIFLKAQPFITWWSLWLSSIRHEVMNGIPLCPFNFARSSVSLLKHKLSDVY